MGMAEEDADTLTNRAHWAGQADQYVAAAEHNWARDTAHWGMFRVSDDDLGLLPDVVGQRTIELGCGTAYVSAWLARRGAVPVGIDNSSEQLATARRMQAAHDLRFPLVWGDAQRLPFADATFDFAISEYGASLWCDPYRWVPEAARVLRPGGRLQFLSSTAFVTCCAADDEEEPATPELRRPYFGMHRVVWPDTDGVEFHLGHSDWVRLLRRSGFELEDLCEVRPPETATTRYTWVTVDWARQWPCEEVFTARRC